MSILMKHGQSYRQNDMRVYLEDTWCTLLVHPFKFSTQDTEVLIDEMTCLELLG